MIGLEAASPTPSAELSYKGMLHQAMIGLAEDPARRFVGYGLLHGRAGGTLKGVPEKQIIETPVAENLMVSMAIGLSLAGLKPLVYIERCDFILNALDALVNHLEKASLISRGQFNPTAIIRVVVGNSNTGLQTGATHTQDFGQALSLLLPHSEVFSVKTPAAVREVYERARLNQIRSTWVILEYKDLL